MKRGENWQCPFCQRFQVLSDTNFHSTSGKVGTELNKHGMTVGKITIIECMNVECREFFAKAELGKAYRNGNTVHPGSLGSALFEFGLRPTSVAKPQHSAVPSPLVTDYEEACAVARASPKASATLARRCLQGMIRDFCGITKSTLNGEITELVRQVESGVAPRQVSEESIIAIDSVRKIGNIGAHFEKDINLIIEVDADEALALINLIELLFQEWYVARFDRQRRLGKVIAIADDKASVRKPGITVTGTITP